MATHKELQGLALMWDSIRFAYTVFGYIVWDWGTDPLANHWVPLYTVPPHLIVQYLRAHPDVTYTVLAMLDVQRTSDFVHQFKDAILMPPPGDIGHRHTVHDPRYQAGRAVFPSYIEKTILEVLERLNAQVKVGKLLAAMCLSDRNDDSNEAFEALVNFEPVAFEKQEG